MLCIFRFLVMEHIQSHSAQIASLVLFKTKRCTSHFCHHFFRLPTLRSDTDPSHAVNADCLHSSSEYPTGRIHMVIGEQKSNIDNGLTESKFYNEECISFELIRFEDNTSQSIKQF